MTGEAGARAYCAAIGKDPDEPVFCHIRNEAIWHRRPRWCWLIGATAALAEGCLDLSPAQRMRRQPPPMAP